MTYLIPLLSVTLPILGGAIGYFIKYSTDKKKELLSEITKERRKHYQNFVDLVIEILKSTKGKGKKTDSEQYLKLFDFYKKYILYASPEVINNFSNLFQYLYLNTKDSPEKSIVIIKKLSNVLKAMRTDLGLSNKKLGQNGENILRALLRDFDKKII